MTSAIDEHELHLYVDGQLSETRRQAVEAYLRFHPEAAAQVADYRRQNELMRELFSALGEMPASEAEERLVRKLEHRLGRSRWALYWRPAAAAAAALVLAAAFGAGTAELFDDRAPAVYEPSFAETAARVHSFYASAQSEPTEFGADAGKVGTLLDKRFGAALRPPDLSPKGFNLVGGRLLPAPDGAAAQLLYRDQAGRMVSVFLGPADKAELTSAHSVERKDLSLYTWLDGRIGVAVVGGLSGDELRGIAEMAQRSLPAQAAHPDAAPVKATPASASRT